MFSNILIGAAGFPVADLGDEINQSLRFTGTQNLTKTMAAGAETTFSCWVKIANLAQTSAMTFIGAGIGTNYVQLYWEGATYETLGADNSNTSFAFTSNKLRDPSAWYHLVYVRTSSDTKIYINGAEASYRTSGTGSNGALSSTTFAIGSYANGTGKFEGYMADVYFVESVKQPSDFGRYQEDGVWVPKNYTGTYGTNGFHLDFADSSDLGNDVSGNNNDFTASGFDTGDVALYSKDLFTNASTATPNYNTTDKTFLASNGADKAFDGSPSTQASTTYSPNTGTWIIFRPSTAIVANSSVQVRTYYNETITVNEVDTGLSNPSSSTISTVDISSALTFPVTIQTIGLRGNSTGSLSEARVFQIIVDGTVLIDNTDNDVDYNDTPTSNYSTYNPLVNNDEPTFNQANLNGDSFNNGIAWATQELPNKHLYCEFIRTAGDRFAAGVWDAEDRFEKGAANDNDYAFGIVYSEFQGNNNIYNESTTASQTGLTAYTTDDVLGVEWRGDLATRQVNFYINGTQVGTSENVAAGGRYYFGVDRAGGSTGPDVQVNFGQMPFIAAPSGVTNTANGMQTNNFAEPTIKNGKEYFEAKLYSGTGSSNAITGLEFSPDLIWIKVRDAADNHVLVDTIRGTDSVLFSNSSDAEASSFSRFTSFDSNGFTVDTTDTSWNNSANDYVAWCWKAGGTAVSNTDGTITSSVSANTDAGFSIVSWTGTQTASQTVGHGLTQAPDLVIYKARDEAANWIVGSSALDPTEYLILDVDNAAASNSTYIPSRPTDSVLNLGSVSSVNNDERMIAYCWHSVEGYSKFGSYTGLGSGTSPDADGPYTYLGFKPAFLLIKRFDNSFGGEWSIHDTTRSPQNPNRLVIAADIPNNEITQGGIDFLSNGFKIRDGGGWTNQSGGTYVYAAFAENPFGGENAPPVTAR